MQQVTREEVPPVPPDQVRIAEYGQVPGHQMRDREEMRAAEDARGLRVTLAYETRGYACAGSCLRWQEARWSVSWREPDGGIHGRNFADTDDGEAEARAWFTGLTDEALVAARRAEMADADARCAAVRAENDAANRAAYLQACADRGLGPETRKARRMFPWYRGG